MGRALVTFSLVSVLWLLFKLPEFHHVVEYVKSVAHNGGAPQVQALYVIAVFSTRSSCGNSGRIRTVAGFLARADPQLDCPGSLCGDAFPSS